MLAVDTNVVVRFLMDDHPGQASQARKLLAENEVFVSTTVILETAWVLRSAYGLSNERCAEALAGLAGLAGVLLEDAAAVAKALGWMQQGLDFADGLHLATAEGCEAFVTFDRDFARVAKRLGDIPIRAP